MRKGAYGALTPPHSGAPLRYQLQGWCKQRSRVDIYTCNADTHAYTKQSRCQGSLSATCPKAPSNSPTQSELKWDVVSYHLLVSQLHTHIYARPPRPPKQVKFVFLLQHRCVIISVCVGFWSVFLFLLCTPARSWQGICDEKSWLEISLPLSLSPLQGLSVVCIFLLVSHLSSHFAPLHSPSSSDLPSDLPLSLSQRADSQPGNYVSAGHHTCCCQCRSVRERVELCPLPSIPLTHQHHHLCCWCKPTGRCKYESVLVW